MLRPVSYRRISAWITGGPSGPGPRCYTAGPLDCEKNWIEGGLLWVPCCFYFVCNYKTGLASAHNFRFTDSTCHPFWISGVKGTPHTVACSLTSFLWNNLPRHVTSASSLPVFEGVWRKRTSSGVLYRNFCSVTLLIIDTLIVLFTNLLSYAPKMPSEPF